MRNIDLRAKRGWSSWIVGAVAFAAITACGNDFDPAARVTDFRLIAVGADKPFAAPGDSVKLSTLYHEPFGRPITWGWTTCPLPDDTTVNACLTKLSELARANALPPVTIAKDQTSYEVTVPTNIFDAVPVAARANALYGVVTIACPGDLTVLDLATVKTGDLPFECREAGTGTVLPVERFAVSVKRLFLYSKDKNQNPPIAGVTWDGAPWPENEIREAKACDFESNTFGDCKGEKHAIVVEAGPNARERGTSEYGSPFSEDVVIQHYATEGVFEFDVKTLDSPKTQWAARKKAQGQTLPMWFVLRDSRGGVSWTTRQVKVL